MTFPVPPNKTDVVVLCFMLFFLLDGWRKGFMRSAIGPLTLLLCMVLGIIYFDLTSNFIKTILFVSAGTTILTIIASILLTLSRNSIDPNYRDYTPFLSHLLGSAVNMAWQGSIFLIIFLLIPLAPLQVYNVPALVNVQTKIKQSLCYFYIVQTGLSQIPALQRIVIAFSILQDPDQMQRVSSTVEFQQFFSDKKVKALVKDDEFMASIKRKDFSKIVANPKILEIFDDDDLMEDFTKLAKRVYALDLPQSKATASYPK